jgi:hypothetical protein
MRREANNGQAANRSSIRRLSAGVVGPWTRPADGWLARSVDAGARCADQRASLARATTVSEARRACAALIPFRNQVKSAPQLHQK